VRYCTDYAEEGKSCPDFYGHDTLYLSHGFINVDLSLDIPRNLDIDGLEEKDLSSNVDYGLSLDIGILSSALAALSMSVDVDWGDGMSSWEGGSEYCSELPGEPS
jgi:hypothetical protein